MVDSTIPLTALADLAELGCALMKRARPSQPSSWRVHYGHAFFEKGVLHGRSIIVLLNHGRAYPEEFDLAATCAVARQLIEVHNAFLYLCEHRISKHEFDFRLYLLALNSCADSARLNTGFGLMNRDEDPWWQHELVMKWIVQALKKNPVFASYDQKRQAQLLKGKWPYLYERAGLRGPLSVRCQAALYRLFSHSVHSFLLSLDRGASGKLSPAGLENTLYLVVETARIYLANMALHYARLRRRAVGTLSPTERSTLEVAVSQGRLTDWLAQLKN